jgi:ClpP class serine protease
MHVFCCWVYLLLLWPCALISPYISSCAAGTFLRGVLDKVGVEPQVQRIGAYKSAGDQLLRRDMSEAQREQLGELLDDIYDHFLDTVAEARGKTREVGGSGYQTAHIAVQAGSQRVG